jgi:cysteinyl-tRNA synthetase
MATATPLPPAPSVARPSSSIRVYNTLSKEKEKFQTVEPGKVGMYLCGPTVYAPAHIGHMVGPVIFDTIKRFLTYCGYQVTWVVNITDVDDKLINKSREQGISMFQLATAMTADYLANLQSLGVDQIDHMPRATDSMDEIIRFVQELIDRGFAYVSDGDVFFEVLRDPQYGQLSNRNADSQQGEGGEAASRKRSPGDFALWKKSKSGEPSWESPWGKGRPGWHIECSAMSRRILGKTFDIHGGGLDLMFPHHENELAQSRCCHGQPMVRYWMHNGLMRANESAGKVGGKNDRDNAPSETTEDVAGKISRSKGAGGLAQLIEQQTGERLRFFLLRTHYRSTNVFGPEALAEAGTALDTFYRLFQRFQRIVGRSVYELDYNRHRDAFVGPVTQDPTLVELIRLRESFLAKMDDDFNTGGAVSDLFDLARGLNRYIDVGGLEETKNRTPERIEVLTEGLRLLRELAAILGLFNVPPKVAGQDALATKTVEGLMRLIIDIRAIARQNKDFATADLVRNGLNHLGISLQDLKEGTTWSQSQ